jgi:DNA-binding response OmpR family regulator
VEYQASVLIVEDNKEWLDTLTLILRSQGYAVVGAHSYKEAKQILSKESFDVAVVDIRLDDSDQSNIDGMKVISEVHSRAKQTNIIAIGGYATANSMKSEFHNYGRTGYIEKGRFEKQEFVEVVKRGIKGSLTFQAEKRSLSDASLDFKKKKDSNHFRYLLQTAIDLYAKTKKRSFSNVLDEMNDQLGYGRNSQTIQNWLRESTIPNSAEVEYFVKKLYVVADHNYKWAKDFFEAAGYEFPAHVLYLQILADHEASEIERISQKFGETPADIFISYARTDENTVRSIYKTLLNKKHRPWMDIHSIRGGENWFRAINKAIDECEIFLAVLSNNSVSRRGVIQKELKKAMDKWEGMLPDDIYILPLRIDDCPIPELLKDLHVIDWDTGKGRKKLLEAIRVGLARRKARG